MSVEENKDLIRRYIEAVDDNHTSDWSILDEYIAEDFLAHNPPLPGVSLDREGMKQAAKSFASPLRAVTRSRWKWRRAISWSATSWVEACTRGLPWNPGDEQGGGDRRRRVPSRPRRQDR
jgi:hypothetical protein